MKSFAFTAVFALTVDQRASRRGPDHVPELLDALQGRGPWLLPPERTAGDEVQLLAREPGAVLDVVEQAARLGGWRLGIGLGAVERPLPRSTRAARGDAYLAAREAVERAQQSPVHSALLGWDPHRGSVTGAAYGEGMDQRLSTHRTSSPGRPQDPLRGPEGLAARLAEAEAALWMWQDLLGRRTAQGWQVADLLGSGRSVGQAAAVLGISASAVSQRHRRAGLEQSLRGRELCAALLGRAQRAMQGLAEAGA